MQYTIRDECTLAPGGQINPLIDAGAPGSNPSQDSNSNPGQVSNDIHVDEAFADKVGPPDYRIWFNSPTTLTFAGGRPKVGASNLFITSRIKDCFLNAISLTVRTVTERFLSKPGTARFDPTNINTF